MIDRTPEEWLGYLARAHEAEIPGLRELNRYYDGEQPLKYLHPALLEELGDQLQQVVINWPRLAVDSLEERLDVEGFRYSRDEDADADLWGIWQANGLDEASQQANLDALIMRRSFLIVGTNEEDPEHPLITVESPLQVRADWDPRTRRVRAALKRWHETDLLTGAVRDQHATLYLPNETRWYEQSSPSGWTETARDEHGLGLVPVAPIVNRPRILVPGGRTELADLIPIADAVCKIATDMMVSAEYHAMPRRVAFGFGEEDFQDENGKPVSVWSRIAGRIWATAKTRKDDGVDVIQFPEAQLANFHSTVELLARLLASMGALPPHFLGLSTDNPPSADAIRSSETRLVKRAERRQRSSSGGYEAGMRLALRIRDGVWDPRAASLETLWRDPSTPTFAQKADAVVKLHSAGILPTEQAREDLGYTAVQRERMRQMDASAADRVMGGDLAALLGPKPAVPEPVPVGG
ncbi:phage portal protein [Kitasatospora sp. HPMI-4]|uniref:phage portal protein n=1 Tax=Kitasatospora sp. HPMI-4 TaxID=3448443 RepID=UPI003F1C750D